MSKTKLIIFSSFSLYFLFIGFLRLRVALEMNKWSFNLNYSSETIFNITSTVTLIIIVIFLYFNIIFKGKITNDKSSK